jgi:hypothetical protein
VRIRRKDRDHRTVFDIDDKRLARASRTSRPCARRTCPERTGTSNGAGSASLRAVGTYAWHVEAEQISTIERGW